MSILPREYLETFVRDPHAADRNEVREMARELLKERDRAADVLEQRAVARARVVELEAQIDRVRKVHEPVEAMNYGHRRPQLTNVCSGCGTDAGNWQMYPCPTIRALEVQP